MLMACFEVTEKHVYRVSADSGVNAIESRKSGHGERVAAASSYVAQEWKGEAQQHVPPDGWPIWAKALSKLASPEDKGIGDVALRMIGAENSIAFKAWFKITFGKDCGCDGRQAHWNKLYPLPVTNT